MIKRVGATKFVSPSKLVSLIKSSKNSFLLSLIPVCYNNISILFLSIAVNPVQAVIFFMGQIEFIKLLTHYLDL